MLFQTSMSFSSAEHKEKIFWRMSLTRRRWLTSILFFTYYGSQWLLSTVWLPTFFKISSFVYSRRPKFIQVWN